MLAHPPIDHSATSTRDAVVETVKTLRPHLRLSLTAPVHKGSSRHPSRPPTGMAGSGPARREVGLSRSRSGQRATGPPPVHPILVRDGGDRITKRCARGGECQGFSRADGAVIASSVCCLCACALSTRGAPVPSPAGVPSNAFALRDCDGALFTVCDT
jgi:hypothetical protein